MELQWHFIHYHIYCLSGWAWKEAAKELPETSVSSVYLMGVAKAFEIGGACASVGQDVCVCLGFLWLLQAGTHGDLDGQIPACRPGILLGVDRQNIG